MYINYIIYDVNRCICIAQLKDFSIDLVPLVSGMHGYITLWCAMFAVIF